MQEQWNELLATALLGTEQRQCVVSAPELEFLNALPTANPTQDHEGWMLLASAFAATYRRAGQIPAASTTPLSPAPPESKPYCSPSVAAHLASALVEVRTMEPLVEEVLLTLAMQSRILPPALLPDILAWAQRNKQPRAWIAPVVGERGRWLVEHNREWKNALQVDAKNTIDPTEALQQITGEKPLYETLQLANNIFNTTFSFFKRQELGPHALLIQLTLEKLTTIAKPGNTYYSEPAISKLAVAVPAAALPILNRELRQLLAAKEYMPWLTTLVDRLEFRQQMLEELNRE